MKSPRFKIGDVLRIHGGPSESFFEVLYVNNSTYRVRPDFSGDPRPSEPMDIPIKDVDIYFEYLNGVELMLRLV